MVFVLTVDQVDSRRQGDLVDAAMSRLEPLPTLRPFVRTVGDEFQGVLEDALSVLAGTLDLMRDGQWHVGVGVGPVELPLPRDTRAARGPAFVAARSAVERAKHQPSHVSVRATPPAESEARDAEVVLRLLAALRERRTEDGWQAVDLVASGATQAQAAERLQVSQQAVSQRLQAASWTLERDATPVLARLLERADAVAGQRST